MFLVKHELCLYFKENVVSTFIERHFAACKVQQLRISHKYGCVVYPTAKDDKELQIAPPVEIAVRDCKIGLNSIYEQVYM